MAKNKPNKWQSRIVGHDKVRADQLLANPRNHRRHPQKQREVVAASIEELGFCKSVIVNQRTGYIVDGHERVMQALGAGDETLVDVEYVDLSEEDERKLLLILDASSELAEVDACDLEELLRTVNTSSQELADWFTELGEAAKIFDPEPESDGDSDLDSVPEDAEPVCKVGDLWILGEHRLLCGDSSDQSQVDRLLAGATIDCVLTDPPYGIKWNGDYTRFTKKAVKTCSSQYAEIRGDNQQFDASTLLFAENVILWGANLYGSSLPVGSWLIWDKRSADGTSFLADAELAWQKGGRGCYIKSINQQSERGKTRDVEHPTKKPVELFVWCLERMQSEMVYDPFLGSGTTLIAAEQLNRRCYGMEIDAKYCDVIIARWEKLTGRKAVKA
jgi:DNA modification methylase